MTNGKDTRREELSTWDPALTTLPTCNSDVGFEGWNFGEEGVLRFVM